MAVKDKIIAEIRSKGPMPLDRYIEICNSHYYGTRDPLGAKGDFTTAPEISQIFGEMIGVWIITQWEKLGKPGKLGLLELGAGRGTLMADILRTLKMIPDLETEIHFVETSPILAQLQLEKVPNAKTHTSIPTLNSPYIAIANEFFDALPIKQLCGNNERKIIEIDGQLAFNITHYDFLREECEIGNKIMSQISATAAAGIIIDYGYTSFSGGDSLQAIKDHKFHHVLQTPGEADITFHVNFAELAKNCKKPVKITTQREFLLAHGADVRAKILGKEQDLDRLISPSQMGELFKVLCF